MFSSLRFDLVSSALFNLTSIPCVSESSAQVTHDEQRRRFDQHAHRGPLDGSRPSRSSWSSREWASAVAHRARRLAIDTMVGLARCRPGRTAILLVVFLEYRGAAHIMTPTLTTRIVFVTSNLFGGGPAYQNRQVHDSVGLEGGPLGHNSRDAVSKLSISPRRESRAGPFMKK